MGRRNKAGQLIFKNMPAATTTDAEHAVQELIDAGLLAGDGYRVVPDDVKHGCWHEGTDPCPVCGAPFDDTPKLLGDLGDYEFTGASVQWRQPDRPEPVDPASVRVGDVVEVEADDGSWMVRGEVGAKDDSYMPPRLLVHAATEDPCWVYTNKATVRVLRRAEPEPDPEQVDLWADALSVVWSTGEVSSTDREVAVGLIRELRRRGVRVDGGERSDG